MKIQVHSAPPMADTGYGTHTRHLLSYLRKDYDLFVQSVSGGEGMGLDWSGIDIVSTGAGDHGEESIPYWFSEKDADVVFSHHDHWAMAGTLSGQQQSGIPMVLYTILDHDLPGKKPPEPVVQANEHAHKTVVMSEWAEDRILRSRIPEDQVEQIPHAVDTSKYAPVSDKISDEDLKKEMGIPEDSFVFGMVAANYGVRKNLPQHMQAFREFREEYDADDAYLYIHTIPQMSGGYNLRQIRAGMEIDSDHLILPDGHKVYHGVDDLFIVQLYNTFDVSLNCTQSESWGLTVTEAMSCGTPVIAANHTAITEQFGVPYDTKVSEDEGFRVTDQGILTYQGVDFWTQKASARRYIPKVGDIRDAMGFYYENQDLIDQHGQNAREWTVNNYDWEVVWENGWDPLFREVEEDLSGSEYDEYYFKRREAETQSSAFNRESEEIIVSCFGDSVLDVGAGTGRLAANLQGSGFDVTAIEYADAGVEYIKEEREEDIEVYQGDIRDLQFKADAFDTTVAQHVLEHVEADVNALLELARVARQKVVAIVPSKKIIQTNADPTEKRRYNPAELERLKEEFESLTDHEMTYEKLHVNDVGDFNWKIELEL